MPYERRQKRVRTRLGDYLFARRITQSSCARLANLSEASVQRIASGAREATQDEAQRIAEALAVPAAELFDPFSGLAPDRAAVERFTAWLRSPEGLLVARRVREVLTGQ